MRFWLPASVNLRIPCCALVTFNPIHVYHKIFMFYFCLHNSFQWHYGSNVAGLGAVTIFARQCDCFTGNAQSPLVASQIVKSASLRGACHHHWRDSAAIVAPVIASTVASKPEIDTFITSTALQFRAADTGDECAEQQLTWSCRQLTGAGASSLVSL